MLKVPLGATVHGLRMLLTLPDEPAFGSKSRRGRATIRDMGKYVVWPAFFLPNSTCQRGSEHAKGLEDAKSRRWESICDTISTLSLTVSDNLH